MLRKIAKKLLIGMISLSLLAPVSIIPNYSFNINVNAKTKVHHHKGIRKKRLAHKHRHRKRIVRRKKTMKRRFRKIRSTNYSKQMAYQTLKDINISRKNHGVPSVKETKPLNRLASVRAHQLIHHFSHYDNHGGTYYKQDAKKMRINLTHYYHNRSASGENIASAGLDHGNIAYTNMPNDPHRYVNKNGYDMANMDEDSMFNYDSGSLWGHRKNILDRDFHYVGIGIAHKGNQYYMAEDFDS